MNEQHEFMEGTHHRKHLCLKCGKPYVSLEHIGYDFCMLTPITIMHGGREYSFTSIQAARKAGFIIGEEKAK